MNLIEKFYKIIVSTKTTLWLLLAFSIAMAAATFMEDHFETSTAMRVVYKAKWFEGLILILAINYIGNISKYNLLSKRKLGGFIFHTAFLLIILGAGVSRYIGFEGLMHVREGESSSQIVSEQKVFRVMSIDKNETKTFDIQLSQEDLANGFVQNIKKPNGDYVRITSKNFIQHPVADIKENMEGGIDCVRLNVLDQGKESDVFILDNQSNTSFSLPFSFNTTNAAGISIAKSGSSYLMKSSVLLKTVSLPDMNESYISPGVIVELNTGTQYSTENNALKFIFNKGYNKALQTFIEGDANNGNAPVIITDIESDSKHIEFPVFLTNDGSMKLQHAPVSGLSLLMGYGERTMRVPFSITLNHFAVERYPGSSNPSSYSSMVTLNDENEGEHFPYKIYMNHVLDYAGYRFFQSSYDRDEKGSVFSVNHDFWGTWLTYAGYFFLALGFILTVFNKNSRFRLLGRSIFELRKYREHTLLLLFGLLFTSYGMGANARRIMPEEHANFLGKIIVQTYEGRFEPLHTLAYDVMHKLSRKDHFHFDGKGDIDAMQVFSDIMLDPEYWKSQKIIYIREKAVAEMLHIEGKYASYNDMADVTGASKLKAITDEAFRKKPQEQNPVDKELIKVAERYDIFIMLSQGSLYRIFPGNPQTHEWISWDNPNARQPMPIDQAALELLRVPELNANNIMGSYLNSIYVAADSGDYTRSEKILSYISSLQRNSSESDLLPSETKVATEEFYNKANIFVSLRNIYGLLAILLFILCAIELFQTNPPSWLKFSLKALIGVTAFAFAYHTIGMILRWYLSGHAPWSNGYEALLLVGWSGLLAGFIFLKYSNIPLAATTLLAFFTLMTASHSSYDPQITNLQPVLKSYWLIIHVATLTISYGFLGLAFILGLFTTTLILFRNERNHHTYNLLIKELTHINEMTMILGLMLATTGTFLGGVWANESWGRYWGWDAKETWALIITMVYSIVVHMRLVDKLRGDFYLNAGSILGFSSVLMTFIGVNYYLSKGMHSYGSGDTPIFPIWAWITIISIIVLIIIAGVKDHRYHSKANQAV